MRISPALHLAEGVRALLRWDARGFGSRWFHWFLDGITVDDPPHSGFLLGPLRFDVLDIPEDPEIGIFAQHPGADFLVLSLIHI